MKQILNVLDEMSNKTKAILFISGVIVGAVSYFLTTII